MKKNELIAKLQELPEDLEIVIDPNRFHFFGIEGVNLQTIYRGGFGEENKVMVLTLECNIPNYSKPWENES